MGKKVRAIVIGAGNRGFGYSKYASDFPEKLQIVGVAEPKNFQQNQMKETFNLSNENVFKDWKDLLKKEKFADCAIIATPDRFHKEPAIAAAKKGYHILLEKPMAVSYEDCKAIVETCKENNRMLAVCHVLRYAPQAIKIQQLISEGKIGDVVNIQLLEPVGFWHFAHSYVRGNWNNEGRSSFSLLAKSCHDLDLIQMWMGKKKCVQISSFGSLKHFRKQEKPEGAGERCLNCSVESSCPYSAKKIYIDSLKSGNKGWPVKVVCDGPVDIENLEHALKNGPYGKCVYDSDNDVMDNQVVTMQYEGGATVTFSMVAFTQKICARQIRIFGTRGEITCDMDFMIVRHIDFTDGQGYTYNCESSADYQSSRQKGHGGADFYAMDSFITAVATDNPDMVMTGPEESLYSHLLCFLAEKARKENRVIQVEQENLQGL